MKKGEDLEKKEKRFEILQTESMAAFAPAQIIQDNQTGSHYLFITQGYAGGLTPLLAREGTPITDEHKK